MSIIGAPFQPTEDERERFFSRLYVAASGCWEMDVPTSNRGYVIFRLSSAKRYVVAHRWSYVYHVGPIPHGKVLDHLCRNRGCVNPTHLEPVSTRTNNLRGIGHAANNARKTMCDRAHEFDAENTRIGPDGRRICKACHRENQVAYRQRRRERSVR